MRFGSICSGIEAASVAWNPLGWEAAWFSEIEPFPCAVLKHHYPDVPNYGDMTKLPEKILSGEIEAPDLICGGTPCQAFSVAGKRESLSDARGNLSLVFCEIVDAVTTIQGESPIVFWENVPGVLNTKDNAFGCFLGQLVGSDVPLEAPNGKWPSAGMAAGAKRCAAWRVLDAQYFGVPQRRRRVFVVAGAGGFDPAKVLFEFPRVRGDFESSSEARQGTPVGPEVRVRGGYREGSFGQFVESEQAGTSKASGGVLGGGSETLVLMDQGGSVMHVETDRTMTLRAQTHGHEPIICLAGNTIGCQPQNGGEGKGWQNDISYTLKATGVHVVAYERVRRLTPRECERLQGFPDDYTKISYRGKGVEDCPDSPRYKAIGNSWAVPVVRWIGERIKERLVNEI